MTRWRCVFYLASFTTSIALIGGQKTAKGIEAGKKSCLFTKWFMQCFNPVPVGGILCTGVVNGVVYYGMLPDPRHPNTSWRFGIWTPQEYLKNGMTGCLGRVDIFTKKTELFLWCSADSKEVPFTIHLGPAQTKTHQIRETILYSRTNVP